MSLGSLAGCLLVRRLEAAELDGGLCRLGSRHGGLGGRWCLQRAVGQCRVGLGLVVFDAGIGPGRRRSGGTGDGSCVLWAVLGGLGGAGGEGGG